MFRTHKLTACALWVGFLAVSLAFAGSEDRESAPRFHAKTLDGQQFNNESVKGKVVLLQFWTTWCPYCKKEESLVDDVATEFADKGLIVLAVDVGESKKTVLQYLKEHPRKCRIVLTGDTNLAAMYAANSYPIYVAIDREGYVAGEQRGAGGERALRDLLGRAGIESKDDTEDSKTFQSGSRSVLREETGTRSQH